MDILLSETMNVMSMSGAGEEGPQDIQKPLALLPK